MLVNLKIGYVIGEDPFSQSSWQEKIPYLSKALRDYIGDVHFLGPVRHPGWLRRVSRFMAMASKIILGNGYELKYNVLGSWYAGRVLRNKIKGQQFDLIIVPGVFVDLSYLRISVPVIYITDVTFSQVNRYYKNTERLNPLSRWEVEHLEKRAFGKSRMVLFTSQWVARIAVTRYRIDPAKVAVLPLGPDIEMQPGPGVVMGKFSNPRPTILFMAGEWEAKGGNIVWETFLELRNKYGMNARLVVCGCVPPTTFTHSEMEVIPLLKRGSPEDELRRQELFSLAHFLLQPTRADSTIAVASEAGAYGLPVITTETGGVQDIIQDGVNGYCLPYHADGRMYALLIFELFTDQEHYRELVESSRARYDNRLNWHSWASDFKKIYFQTHQSDNESRAHNTGT